MGVDGKLFDQGLVGVIKPSTCILRDRFLYPPFSVFDTRNGLWADRRRRWLALGIKSELGRGDGLTYVIVKDKEKYDGQGVKKRAGVRMSGTSIFDPVLTELCYSWWCPLEGIIVDPFAGGSVRGIVASVLGRKYWGCDLRREQIEANIAQLSEVATGRWLPKWVCGDSRNMLDKAPPADFVFTSPPYGDLERYSDDPQDISTMNYDDFLANLGGILDKACSRLRPNRYTAIVVANFRDKTDGTMRDLVGDTIRIFTGLGLKFYNEIVLINMVGTGMLRASATFLRGSRKVVKLHQQILVFVKGDPKLASEGLEKYDVDTGTA